MTDQFVGEIRPFGFNFAPTGWAQCNGQLLPISQNTALFALLGTFYGGDGKSTFALPNLNGKSPLAYGDPFDLSERLVGEEGGSSFVTLIQSEMPVHDHALSGTTTIGEVSTPVGSAPLSRSSGKAAYHAPDGNMTTLAPQTISVAGGDQPHNNLMPYLVLNFCIALQGIFPPRS